MNLEWGENVYYVDGLIGLPLMQYNYAIRNVRAATVEDFPTVRDQIIDMWAEWNVEGIDVNALQTCTNIDSLINIVWSMLWSFGGSFPQMTSRPTMII